jgi:hypothetical protein
MANFLIDLFKKASKPDGYRTTDSPTKYNDNIAALNATNQSAPTTSKLARAQVNTPTTSGNSTIPGR